MFFIEKVYIRDASYLKARVIEIIDRQSQSYRNYRQTDPVNFRRLHVHKRQTNDVTGRLNYKFPLY